MVSKRLLHWGCMALALPIGDGFAQERVAEVTSKPGVTNSIEDLKPLLAELQRAVEAGDLDRSEAALDSLRSAITKARASLYSPKSLVESMEKTLMARPALRPALVGHLAFMSEKTLDYDKARTYAIEALSLATRGSEHEAENTYYGNHVLGLLALRQNDVIGAKNYLLASVDHQGWKGLARFGPNVLLAMQVLERGERDTVVEFLERCKKVWPKGLKTIENWQATTRAGGMPDFGVNRLMIP